MPSMAASTKLMTAQALDAPTSSKIVLLCLPQNDHSTNFKFHNEKEAINSGLLSRLCAQWDAIGCVP